MSPSSPHWNIGPIPGLLRVLGLEGSRVERAPFRPMKSVESILKAASSVESCGIYQRSSAWAHLLSCVQAVRK